MSEGYVVGSSFQYIDLQKFYNLQLVDEVLVVDKEHWKCFEYHPFTWYVPPLVFKQYTGMKSQPHTLLTSRNTTLLQNMHVHDGYL